MPQSEHLSNSETVSLSKAEKTRLHILEQAAALFNQQGYAGTSMADIMAATGLKKGGLYNHFESKEDIALQAFDFAIAKLQRNFAKGLVGQLSAIDRLCVFVTVFERHAQDPPVPGGCPILNTAVESDDTHPALRLRAQQALEIWHRWVCKTVQRGIDQGELRASVDPDAVATLLISTLEGAIMMSRLYGSDRYMNQVMGYLSEYVEGLRSSN